MKSLRRLVGKLLRALFRVGLSEALDRLHAIEAQSSALRKFLKGNRKALSAFEQRSEAFQERFDSQARRMLDRIDRLDHDLQSVMRRLYVDAAKVPFPEALTLQRFGVHSQNEEDGLVLAIFNEIGMGKRRFVEVGCGVNGGNSGFLALECGWTGLMIDASEDRVAKIRNRFPRATALVEWITREGINSILQKHGFTGEIDLLSIDIDSTDYWVWEALTVCWPRLVIVEYNSLFGADRAVTVPYEAQFDRHAKGHSQYYGASLLALDHLAKKKGYRLVAVEPRGVNAFFLRNDLGPRIPSCEVKDVYRFKTGKYKNPEDAFREMQSAGLPFVDVLRDTETESVAR